MKMTSSDWTSDWKTDTRNREAHRCSFPFSFRTVFVARLQTPAKSKIHGTTTHIQFLTLIVRHDTNTTHPCKISTTFSRVDMFSKFCNLDLIFKSDKKEQKMPEEVGKSKEQFKAMIDAARTNPNAVSAMIPGRLTASDKGSSSWQADVRRAVFDPQIVFSMILDGEHGHEAAIDCYTSDHFILFSNQRTFDTDNGDSPPARMMIWNGESNLGSIFYNLFNFGLPVSLGLISSLIPGLMKKSQYHDITYDCVAIYILPKWDPEKGEFEKDTWMETGVEPDDLEDRYALSFTLCNGKSVRSKDNEKSTNGRGGKKGDDLTITFYEVHGNKFYRDEEGTLKARHCFLSEYDDLEQSKDVFGKDLPEPDNAIRVAFKSFLEKNKIECFTDVADFDKGIKQFKEQFELCRGVAPTRETSSLT